MAALIAKAARKPRTRKPDPEQIARVEAALMRLVNPPAFVCGSTRTVDGLDWNVTLFSDDTVRITVDAVPAAAGRFVASTHVTAWGSLAIESRIVDVTPYVSPDIVESLAGDLTYFAMRAGRFSGKAVQS